MRRFAAILLALMTTFLSSSPAAIQQTPAKSLSLVMPTGTGAISIPLGGDWQPSKLFLYDKGTRTVIQLSNEKPGLELPT